jgi:hypothetical protein
MNVSEPAAGDGNADLPHAPEAHPRSARMIIAIALVVFAVMIALLLLRWMTAQEPTSLVVVQGNENQDGFKVQLKTQSGLVVRSTALSQRNGYEAKFHVPSGTYEMSVLRGDQALFRQKISLRESMGLVYDLATVPTLATTAPSAP